MEILKTVMWIVQIVSALSVIVLVLLQQGKGADAGATFGSSGSSSLFGSSGSANFLSRSTAACAAVFFMVTLALVILFSNGKVGDLGVMATADGKVVSSSPVAAKTTKAPAESSNQIPE